MMVLRVQWASATLQAIGGRRLRHKRNSGWVPHELKLQSRPRCARALDLQVDPDLRCEMGSCSCTLFFANLLTTADCGVVELDLQENRIPNHLRSQAGNIATTP